MSDLVAAEQFLAAHARILDRRRFERHFRDGDAAPVRDAVAAYRNADGGFGNGLEPDGRAPGSQATATMFALRTLHEADAWDDDLVMGVLTWLESVEPEGGGVTFVDPSIEGWPAAPWWRPVPGLPPSPLPTGVIAATLIARGVEHPWLDRAVAWMAGPIETATEAYDLIGVCAFVNASRDEAAVDRLAPRLRTIATTDPAAPGETHSPLSFAPRPDSVVSKAFDDLAPHVDALAEAQQADGGWTFNWPAWSPAAEADWRGSLTVDALLTLEAFGRLRSG